MALGVMNHAGSQMPAPGVKSTPLFAVTAGDFVTTGYLEVKTG